MITEGLTDTHCHLDLYPNHVDAFAECDRDQVFTIAVTTTPKAWPHNHELAQDTRFVRAALGLHPQLVAQVSDREIALWERYLEETHYVGEVGLDAGRRYYRSLDRQKAVFERVLRCCAVIGNRVLSVHAVRSASAALDLIEYHLPVERGRVVLHWFSGTVGEARRAEALGCYFSVNLPMMQADAGRKIVAQIPLGRILTETDGPFTRVGDRVARPGDVGVAVEALAQLRGLNPIEVVEAVRRNLRGLVQFADPADPYIG